MVDDQDLKEAAKQVGGRIQEIRKAAGLTQVELEEKTGVYDVGAIERGETNPTLLTLLRLATALKVSPGEFFSEEEEPIRAELWGLIADQDKEVQKKAVELVRVLLG